MGGRDRETNQQRAMTTPSTTNSLTVRSRKAEHYHNVSPDGRALRRAAESREASVSREGRPLLPKRETEDGRFVCFLVVLCFMLFIYLQRQHFCQGQARSH